MRLEPKGAQSTQQLRTSQRRLCRQRAAQPQWSHSSRRRTRHTARTTIVLAEEQQLVRRGIRCLLETEKTFDVVGETGDGREVLSLVQRLRPKVLVIAVGMPGLNGLEVARQVHERCPAVGVVMVSTYSKEEYVAQALRNGASGYVLKRASPSELVRAIRHAVAGQHYLSAPLSDRSIRAWLVRAKREVRDYYDALTDREREVLQLVAEGYTSVSIARRLGISSRTVEAHRASVMRKMQFGNLVDVILFAIDRGIIVPARFDPLPSDRS